MHITLKQLQVFICITQEKTITAAALKLFISKPAVSMALAELEKQLGHKLFERKNNRLIINEQGRQLLPLADEQIERSKEISSLFKPAAQSRGKLKIGSSNTIGNHVIPSLLGDFRVTSSQSSQSLLIDNSTFIAQQLKDYELDIGLVEANIFDSELHSSRWLQDEMLIVCNSGHQLAQKKQVALKDLEKQQWILRENGSGTRDFFLKQIGEKLAAYEVSLELNTTEAIINCVSAGLGISCMSKLAARHALKDRRLVQLDLKLSEDITMTRDYWLILHKEKYQSPLLKQFIEFAQNWKLPF
ncbi:LysR family transcriptional regulator [Psychromonas aquimarina]|uniref:LysR family transcriptional regulator n=1 Tax=Psychromonas aquimarina TaxID=444919 RepID=UPI0004123ADF|nr:LysR family transcriptional regulator [Psychromonas aquimarina]